MEGATGEEGGRRVDDTVGRVVALVHGGRRTARIHAAVDTFSPVRNSKQQT